MGPGSTDLPFAATFVEIEILFVRFTLVFLMDFFHVWQKSGFELREKGGEKREEKSTLIPKSLTCICKQLDQLYIY